MSSEHEKPTVFIASSSDAEHVRRDVALLAERAGGKPLQWPDAFPVGKFTLESLIDASNSVDAALIIASPDDKGIIRKKTYFMPRDNILVELGIFLSALGRKKAALVYVEKGGCQPRLPSDLNGLTYLAYSEDTPEENYRRIREWLEALDQRVATVATLPPPKDARYSWDHVSQGIQFLTRRIAEDGYRPDAILGLGRSGGIVGGLLGSFLGAVPLSLLDLKYHEDGQGLNVDFREEKIDIPGQAKKVLVVEGATVAGMTPRKAKELLVRQFPQIEFRFAFLIRSTTSQFKGDYFAYLHSGEIVSLPWHGPKSKTYLTVV